MTHQWLGYQTPVLGYPWTIPFEFPIYQWIVAMLYHLIPLSLDTIRRLVSIAFLYLTLISLHILLRNLALKHPPKEHK